MNKASSTQTFELCVQPLPDGTYGLALYRSPVGATTNGGPECVARIRGDALRAVIEPVLSAIRRAGYKPSDLGPSRRQPFRIGEEDGVRLGVLFLALRPLRKASRMEAVLNAVRGMADEELYYWYSKATAIDAGRRAQRALRTLVAEE